MQPAVLLLPLYHCSLCAVDKVEGHKYAQLYKYNAAYEERFINNSSKASCCTSQSASIVYTTAQVFTRFSQVWKQDNIPRRLSQYHRKYIVHCL